jgi:hypothetical protein
MQEVDIMGDEVADFTQEELETLGEAEVNEFTSVPETEEEQGTEAETVEVSESDEQSLAEPEESAQEPEVADTAQDKENFVPQSRFDKVYGKQKDMERKYDLLRELGPDKYYEVYPDEKQAQEQDARHEPPPQQSQPAQSQDPGSMVVQGGAYDGQTLNEVYVDDPFAAQKMYSDFLQRETAERVQQETAATQMREDSQREVDAFKTDIAKELYQAEAGSLDTTQAQNVDNEVSNVLTWMQETGRGGGRLEDAYFLMNKDRLLQEASTKSVKGMVQNLSRGSVPSVSGNKSTGLTGYDAYTSLSSQELAGKIDGMTDIQFSKFVRNAPKTLRNKHPGIDWD